MPISPLPTPNSCLPGDAEAALQADYAQFYGQARAFAERYVGDVWADDAVQDAFVALWTVWYKDGRERPLESSHRMFYRILRRGIVDRVRALRRENERNADPAFLTAPHLRLERGTTTAQVAEASFLARRIEYLVGAMPDSMRRVHQASIDHHGDVRAIATALGMNEQAVYKQLKRARARLADQLRRDGYDVPGEPEVHRVREP